MTALHCFSSSAAPSAAAMCLETPPLPSRVPLVGFTRAVTACSVRLPLTTYAHTHTHGDHDGGSNNESTINIHSNGGNDDHKDNSLLGGS